MNFLYKHINQTVLYGNFMNMPLIIIEGNYDATNADDSSFNGYYSIIVSLSPYSLKGYFNIDVQVISSGEIVC